jgi:Glyoxalase-like domain
VLGCVVPPPPEGFATGDDFDRTLPPEDRGLHLDVRIGTGLGGEERLAALETECARLVPLGAVRVRLLPADDDNESCIVMQDIEGNEFCLD